MSDDRTVYATNGEWSIVRYDRAGKWFAEWAGDPADAPNMIGPEYLRILVARTGRAALTIRTAALVAVNLGMVIRRGLPGGSAFDRATARIESEAL